ncbi:hypothetical protein ACFVX9_39760, partial [Kitasatospora sp. NPDC058243]|uniref:hypothetical protein n=1 Tax=Kitasatospora sp. NPDC058243 TaxID=3346397 RepID=UPI0036DD4FDD
ERGAESDEGSENAADRRAGAKHTRRQKANAELPNRPAEQLPPADEDTCTTSDTAGAAASAGAWNIFDAHQEAQQW